MIDLETNALSAIQSLQNKNEQLLSWCENVHITSVTEQKRVEEVESSIKYAEKQVKEQLDNLISPLLESIKRIRALFKPYQDKLSLAKSNLQPELDRWRKEQLSITNEEIAKRAEDYWEKRKEAEATGEVVELPDLGIAPPASTSHHNLGTTNYRPHIKVTIYEPSSIPREYCMPSESLLRKAGELALAQNKPLPLVEGAVIEIEYKTISRR